MKKSIAILLCLTLLVTGLTTMSPVYAAASGPGLETVRGAAYFKPNINDEGVSDFYYSDNLFKSDSLYYDPSLASASVALCGSSLMSMRVQDNADGYRNRIRNLRSFLEDNGFIDFDASGEYLTKAESADGYAVACAHKRISDGGKDYTLLTVVPRSGTNDFEFGYDFMLSGNEKDTDDLYDFKVRRDAILRYCRNYIASHDITGDIKVWMSGYSRAAGIVNMTAATVIDDPKGSLGSGINLTPDNFYCYTFGTPNQITISKDYSSSRYSYIHNVFDENDLFPVVPPEDFGFTRYGEDIIISSPQLKDSMLSLLKASSPSDYERYLASDPDDYTPLMIDVKALLKGDLEFIKDSDSYLPNTQREFNLMIGQAFSDLTRKESESGTNRREGYYRVYQTPLMHLGDYVLEDISNGRTGVVKSVSGNKKLIPLLFSMYITFIADKHIDDKDALIKEHLEGAFNALAAFAEDEKGKCRSELSSINKQYRLIRDSFFRECDNIDNSEGIPQKYELRYDVSKIRENRKISNGLMNGLRKMTALLYSSLMKDALSENDIEQYKIDVLTSSEDSMAISFLLAEMLFGNPYQSSKLQPFSLNNEQFRHMATLFGNAKRMIIGHAGFVSRSWLAAADPNYDGFTIASADRYKGYRRVYVNHAQGASVSGTVTDPSGNILATFENGVLKSSADQWIRITTCDIGSWLRLPVDKDYLVDFSLSKDARINIKVADYSVDEGKAVRTVKNDNEYNWTGLNAKAADQYTLNIPSVEKTGDGYDLTSAYYSLGIKKGSAAVPKLKNVKVKAASRGFTVSWKKLTAA
ncbi:MAG: hypothetical protein IJH92_05000, partial [Mogibacterium sp.]|nr:hypothetical protein [Mogibacterium sp.]